MQDFQAYPGSTSRFPSRRAAGLLAIAAALLAALPASAQVTWDADGGTSGPQDGAGTWNTTATNWWDGRRVDANFPSHPSCKMLLREAAVDLEQPFRGVAHHPLEQPATPE